MLEGDTCREPTVITLSSMSGGKRKSDNWDYFEKQFDRQRHHNFWWVKCKACIEAYHNMGTDGFGAADTPQAFVSRPEKLDRHVKDCRHIAEQLRLQRARREEQEEATQAARELAARVQVERQHVDALTNEHEQGIVDATARAPPRRLYNMPIQTFLDRALSPQEAETFHRLILELTVDANIPMAWVGRDSFKDIVRFLRPSAVEHVPHRKTLGGTILQQHAAKAKVPISNLI